MADNYGIDPTGLLTVPIPAPGLSGLSGLAKVDLPIAAFEPSEKSNTPARLYVRAFAQTAQKNQSACWNNPIEVRKGACIRRYAFNNPVWAVPNPKERRAACSRRARSIVTETASRTAVIAVRRTRRTSARWSVAGASSEASTSRSRPERTVCAARARRRDERAPPLLAGSARNREVCRKKRTDPAFRRRTPRVRQR